MNVSDVYHHPPWISFKLRPHQLQIENLTWIQDRCMRTSRH
jgi:hypothetical protein